ncbi:MAG: site-2 protease family protein [Candidatus Levybacteria bacterium]|nr:site-2 protease family protein [Candidatus Levybacteria bacterium]
MTILIFLVILSVLVLIHELGHFLIARRLNIIVEEFGFGFPVTPALFSLKRGETKYSFYPVLIGGFVKLYGEDEAGGGRISTKNHVAVAGNLKRAFFARPVGDRAAVVVAGVVMNALLAALIYYVMLGWTNYKTDLPLITDHKFFLVNQTNYNTTRPDLVVGLVVPDSPADRSGIKKPSKIVSVNGEAVKDNKSFSELVNKNKGKELTITLKSLRTDQAYTVQVTPRVNPPKGEGPLGVAFIPVTILSYQTPVQRALSGFIHPFNLMSYNVDVLSDLIAVSFKEKTVEPVGSAVSGPIGIFVVFNDIGKLHDLQERLLEWLNLAGLLSVALAFFNILPIPALDGGRLLFILIEAISRKKVNQRVEVIAHTVGMILLLGLLFLVTIKEFSQFIIPLLPK